MYLLVRTSNAALPGFALPSACTNTNTQIGPQIAHPHSLKAALVTHLVSECYSTPCMGAIESILLLRFLDLRSYSSAALPRFAFILLMDDVALHCARISRLKFLSSGANPDQMP